MLILRLSRYGRPKPSQGAEGGLAARFFACADVAHVLRSTVLCVFLYVLFATSGGLCYMSPPGSPLAWCLVVVLCCF